MDTDWTGIETGSWDCVVSSRTVFLQHLLSEVLHSPSSFFTSGTTDIFCLRFLMEAQLGALIKVEILNASHSEGTE